MKTRIGLVAAALALLGSALVAGAAVPADRPSVKTALVSYELPINAAQILTFSNFKNIPAGTSFAITLADHGGPVKTGYVSIPVGTVTPTTAAPSYSFKIPSSVVVGNEYVIQAVATIDGTPWYFIPGKVFKVVPPSDDLKNFAITVKDPADGKRLWTVGSRQTVQWDYAKGTANTNLVYTVRISLVKDGTNVESASTTFRGSVTSVGVNGTPAAVILKSHAFVVPQVEPGQYHLKIATVSDAKSGQFAFSGLSAGTVSIGVPIAKTLVMSDLSKTSAKPKEAVGVKWSTTGIDKDQNITISFIQPVGTEPETLKVVKNTGSASVVIPPLAASGTAAISVELSPSADSSGVPAVSRTLMIINNPSSGGSSGTTTPVVKKVSVVCAPRRGIDSQGGAFDSLPSLTDIPEFTVGASVGYAAVVTPGKADDYTVTWRGTGWTGTGTRVSHTYTSAGLKQVSVRVTNAEGRLLGSELCKPAVRVKAAPRTSAAVFEAVQDFWDSLFQ